MLAAPEFPAVAPRAARAPFAEVAEGDGGAPPLAQVAIRNTLWNGLQFAVSSLAGLASSAVVARSLSPAGMGAYAYLTWVAAVAVVVASLGLGEAQLKYVSEFLGKGDRGLAALIARRLLRVQLAAAAIVALVSLASGFVLLGAFRTTAILLTAALVLPQALAGCTNGILAGVQRYDQLALVSCVGSLAQMALVSVAAWWRPTVNIMLAATLASAAFAVALGLRTVYRVFLGQALPAAAGDVTGVFRRVRLFSAMVAFNLIVDLLVWQRSEVFLLKRYWPLSVVAFYSIAYTFAAKTAAIADTISGALLPVFSSSFGSHGARALAAPFRTALKYVQMVMVPLCVAGVLLIGPLLRLLYGTGYEPATAAAQVLMAGVVLTSMAGLASATIYATDHAGFLARWLAVAAVAKVTLAFALIPRFSLIGAALANLAAQALVVIVMLRFVGRLVGARFPWSSTAKVWIAALLAATPAAATLLQTAAAGWRLTFVIAAAPLYLGVLHAIGELGGHERAVVAECWQAVKVYLRRFPRLRSLRYFVVEFRQALLADARHTCELEYRAQIDPLGYERECEQRRFYRALQMLDQARGPGKFARALEVGCAEGAFTRVLAPRCQSLIAVDFSPTALARAMERFACEPTVDFRHLDLRREDLPAAFDLIVAIAVLEYLYRPGELRRVRDKLIGALRPGGYLLLGSTVRHLVIENSSWARWLPRGTHLNAWVARHPQVRVVAEATDQCAWPFQHVLLQKEGGPA